MKSNFSYKDIYVEDGKKVLEMNILPEKYCNFDCVFCPIGRSKNKIDEPVSFEDYSSSISELDLSLIHISHDITITKEAPNYSTQGDMM